MSKKAESAEEFNSSLDEQMEQALAGPPAKPPVAVSGEAQHALAEKLRQWSGWSDATLMLGDPRDVDQHAPTDTAMVDQITHTFYANPDVLVLNPNRVLHTITPFRLRQEAVLTGALLHECGHARFSNWHTEDEMRHDGGHGDVVNPQTMSLARLMEEPRVEGFIAKQSPFIGASGLDWTMRACAHELLPMTVVSHDPDQAVMDFITSWALRAGRELALSHHTDHKTPRWVLSFNNLLEEVLIEHFDRTPDVLNAARPRPSHKRAADVFYSLVDMLKAAHHSDTWMVDKGREIMI
jgi:hypothetical protein